MAGTDLWSVRIETPTGVWHVRRRWAPRHLGAETAWSRFRTRFRKVRRRSSDFGDIPDPGCSVDIVEGIFVFIAVIVFVLFLIVVGIPFLIALGELLILGVVALAGIVGRVLFRRPWTIDAVAPTGAHHTWSIVGWRASEDARRIVAKRITTSGTVPPEDELGSG